MLSAVFTWTCYIVTAWHSGESRDKRDTQADPGSKPSFATNWLWVNLRKSLDLFEPQLLAL